MMGIGHQIRDCHTVDRDEVDEVALVVLVELVSSEL